VNLWRRIYVERRPIALPLVVILLANLAVLALVVLPLRRSVSSYQEGAVDAKAKLADAMLEQRRSQNARASKERADQELKKFYANVLPTSYSNAISLADFWLLRIAGESGVTIKNTQHDTEDVRDSQLERVKGRVTLIGEYANIRRFLYDVETAQEFVIIQKVELAQNTQAQGGNGSLEVTLDIATYYLLNRGAQAGGGAVPESR
jgi:Tfp pilus assembly protein PilO